MPTVRKVRLRIKWKNLIIFLILVFLTIFGFIKITQGIIKLATTKKEKPKVVEKKKKKITDLDKKLEKLDNINQEIEYFNEDYIDRYISYKEKHTEYPTIQIIKNVNMNLDLEPYKDIVEAKYLNTEKVLVNKYYYLSKDYVPLSLENISTKYALSNMKLVSYAKDAFEEMAKDAQKEKLKIVAMSTYRSYDYQVNLYNKYVKSDGKEKADTYSGRPGHSEHQTGLAVDVYNVKTSYTNFESTKEFEWMQEHAHEYGFILRFPKDKEDETGYIYESWHYRYVGTDIAKYIHDKHISYEEYFATMIKDS